MSRDLGYYRIRIVVYIVLSLCIGSVFFNVGTSYNAIIARIACGGFLSGFMTMMSIGGFPSFIEEMKVTLASFTLLFASVILFITILRYYIFE